MSRDVLRGASWLLLMGIFCNGLVAACRLARRVIVNGEKVSKAKVAAGVLGTTYLNLAGMGATLVGLQARRLIPRADTRRS